MEDKKIKLTDIPYGDSYTVVYTLEYESKKRFIIQETQEWTKKASIMRFLLKTSWKR